MSDETNEPAPSNRRAAAQMKAPVDIGSQIQRMARLQEALLDRLEAEALVFLAAKPGAPGSEIPKDFGHRMAAVTESLNSLTLSHARYVKAEDEWASSLTPDEKLENLANFVLSQYKERPDHVASWLAKLLRKVNNAGDTTKKTAAKVTQRLTVDEAEDPNDRPV